MPSVFMINIGVGGEGNRIGQRGELSCNEVTRPQPTLWGAWKLGWLFRVVPIWGEVNCPFYPQHLQTFGCKLLREGDNDLGKGSFLQASQFLKRVDG